MNPIQPAARTAAAKAAFGLSSLLIGIVMLSGCQWQAPRAAPPDQLESAPSAVVHVAPKELIRLIQSSPPLGITIESATGGTLLTAWKEYEGELHIVRHWQERTRFKIIILPDFDDPTGTSHVQVFDQTEEKPSDPQPWYPAPNAKRSARAAEMLAAVKKLGGK